MDDQKKYKRFMVFEEFSCDNGGGLRDCMETFDTLDDAVKYAENTNFDLSYVFDRIEGTIKIIVDLNYW